MVPNNPPITALRMHCARTGVEACRSLNELSLRDNRIRSMAPLAALAALRSLDLTGNRVAVIEGLNASSSAPVDLFRHQTPTMTRVKLALCSDA